MSAIRLNRLKSQIADDIIKGPKRTLTHRDVEDFALCRIPCPILPHIDPVSMLEGVARRYGRCEATGPMLPNRKAAR